MGWWNFFLCFNDICIVPSLCLCPSRSTKSRKEVGREVRRKCNCNLYKICEWNVWSHPGSQLAPCSLECRKNSGIRPVFHWPQPVGHASKGKHSAYFSLLLSHLFFYMYLVFLVFLTSSFWQAAMQSAVKQPCKAGKSVTMSWLIKYFSIHSYTVYSIYFNFLINCSIIALIYGIKLQKLY